MPDLHPMLQQAAAMAKSTKMSAVRVNEVATPSLVGPNPADQRLVKLLREETDYVAAYAEFANVLAEKLFEVDRLVRTCSADVLMDQLEDLLHDEEFRRQLDGPMKVLIAQLEVARQRLASAS